MSKASWKALSAIAGLASCLLLAACEGDFCVHEDAAWSPAGDAVALVSPAQPSDLFIVSWPDSRAQPLGSARPGYRFHRPVWLRGQGDSEVVGAVEMAQSHKKSEEEPEIWFRFFPVGGGEAVQTVRLFPGWQLLDVRPGPTGRSLIFAAGHPGRWLVAELDVATGAARLLLESGSDDWQVLISEQGHRIAVFENGSAVGPPARRLAIFDTQVAWHGIIALWEIPSQDDILSGVAVELIAWLPDGSSLLLKRKWDAAQGALEELGLLRVFNGRYQQIHRSEHLGQILWDADSRLVAFQSAREPESGRQDDPEIELWLYDTRLEKLSPAAVGGWPHLAGWHPDGRLMVLQRKAQALLVDLHGRSRLQLLSQADESTDLLISPLRRIGLQVQKKGGLTWISF